MSTPEVFVPFMSHGQVTPVTVAGTLLGALELLGPDGENWIKDDLRGPGETYCAVGALEQAAPNYESYVAARDVLKIAADSNHLDRWNNGADFTEVKAAMQQAAALALFGSGTMAGKFGPGAHI